MTQCVNRSSSYSNPAGASSWRKGCRPQLQLALQLRNMHWISYFNGFELHQARDKNKHWQVLYTQVHLTAISPPFEKKKKRSHLAQWLKLESISPSRMDFSSGSQEASRISGTHSTNFQIVHHFQAHNPLHREISWWYFNFILETENLKCWLYT